MRRRPRSRQLLLKTLDASGMHRSLAAGSSYQKHGMQMARVEAPPPVAPAENKGYKRHASKPRRRQLPPATLDACGMRRSPAAGRSCQQHWMQAPCVDAAPPATPAKNNGCKRHASKPRRRQLLPATLDASAMRRSPAAGNSCQNNGCKRHALKPRRRQLLPETLAASAMHRRLAAGSSCQKLLMETACGETSPPAAPARNNGCKRHAMMPRRHGSCQQHRMQAEQRMGMSKPAWSGRARVGSGRARAGPASGRVGSGLGPGCVEASAAAAPA